MKEQGSVREGPSPMAGGVEPDKQGDRPPMRGEPRDQEPLIIEIAWLVIEAATAFYRLRRILTRL